MKVLLTGSTGYIGRRLLEILVIQEHEIICLVRNKKRFDQEDFTEKQLSKITLIECDLLESTPSIPKDIDVAYYLVHSLNLVYKGFKSAEQIAAKNFIQLLSPSNCRQIIYLGGIANDTKLSEHLDSRKSVESILSKSAIPLTVLRAGIIIGSGSGSFEIIRGLVEKLPIMVTPKWLQSKSQPLGIRNVVEFLYKVALKENLYGKIFDIGGPDIMTYKEILHAYAKKRGLKRYIITLPVLTPRLSSWWLFFVTGTSFTLARNLIDSLVNDAVCKKNDLSNQLGIQLLNYETCLDNTFHRIRDNQTVSSWKDSIDTTSIESTFLNKNIVPKYGCFKDIQKITLLSSPHIVLDRIWDIGGNNGWYFGNTLWQIRGFLDQLIGGVGLRRGRRDPHQLKTGDALDFWRVLFANKKDQKLLLYAEMKLPGEAWLEFKLIHIEGKAQLVQTATFRPKGITGRLYWYLMWPFHKIIFPKMAKNIVKV